MDISETVKNGGTFILEIDDTPILQSLPTGTTYPLNDTLMLLSFTGTVAKAKLVALLKKGKNVHVTLVSPDDLLEKLDVSSDSFSLDGYVATKLKAQEYCEGITQNSSENEQSTVEIEQNVLQAKKKSVANPVAEESEKWLFKENKPLKIEGVDSSNDITDLYLIIDEFKNTFKNRDIEKLSDFIHYPLLRKSPILPILNEEQFYKRYNEIFDEYLIKEIIESDTENDWSQMGEKGVMFKSGVLWLDLEGKVIAVNYQSQLERKLTQEYLTTFDRPIDKVLGYGIKNKKFITADGLIQEGCFGNLMTELNGDDTVAAIFLNRTMARGCIDANHPFPGGIEDEVSYDIVKDLGNETWGLRICQVVHGSLRETCSNVIVKFINREYIDGSEVWNVLSLEKLGEW